MEIDLIITLSIETECITMLLQQLPNIKSGVLINVLDSGDIHAQNRIQSLLCDMTSY